MLVRCCIVAAVGINVDEMGPMLLHWSTMVAVDDFDRFGNGFEESAERWSNAIVMTIVSANFDSMPNVVLDSMLNVYNLYNQ